MDCSKPGSVSPLSPGVCSSSFRLNGLCCQTNSSSVYVCVCVRKCCHFILLHVAVQFSQDHFCRNWWADFLNKYFLSFTPLGLIWGMLKHHCVTRDLLLMCTDTPVEMPRFSSCSTACRILVHWPEVEVMCPTLWGRFFLKRFICLFM